MTPKNKTDTKELIEILTAISLVSKRLAANLARKNAADKASCHGEGGVQHGAVPASARSS